MKRIALILFLACVGGTSYATAFPGKTFVSEGVSKLEVSIEQLPEAVQKTLEGARFTGWKPIMAYRVTSGNTEYFEITFVRGDEIEKLLLNQQGGKVG